MFTQIRHRLQVITAVLMVVFAGLALVAFRAYSDMKADRDRQKENQSLLLHNGEVEIKQTNTGSSQASVPALTLRSSEFRQSGDTLLQVACRDKGFPHLRSGNGGNNNTRRLRCTGVPYGGV